MVYLKSSRIAKNNIRKNLKNGIVFLLIGLNIFDSRGIENITAYSLRVDRPRSFSDEGQHL